MPGLSYYGYEDPNQRENIYSSEGWLGAMAGGMGMEAMGKGLAGGGMIFGRGGGLAARQAELAAKLGGESFAARRSVAQQARTIQGTTYTHKQYSGQYTKAQARRMAVSSSAGSQSMRVAASRSASAAAATSTSKFYAARGKSLIRSGRLLMGATLFTTMYELGKSAVGAGQNFRKTKEELAQARNKVYDEDTFSDSRAAFTQRQRAIQVIHNSQMGVRSAMGSEASYLHF